MSSDAKIFKKSEKTIVHFFPECEKVNNRFTKNCIRIFDSSEFSEVSEYSDELEFSSPQYSESSKFFEPSEYSHASEYSESSKFFEPSEYSHVSEYSVSIKIFDYKFFDHEKNLLLLLIAGLAGGIQSSKKKSKF